MSEEDGKQTLAGNDGVAKPGTEAEEAASSSGGGSGGAAASGGGGGLAGAGGGAVAGASAGAGVSTAAPPETKAAAPPKLTIKLGGPAVQRKASSLRRTKPKSKRLGARNLGLSVAIPKAGAFAGPAVGAAATGGGGAAVAGGGLKLGFGLASMQKLTAPKHQLPLQEVLEGRGKVGQLTYNNQVVNCNKENLDRVKKLGHGSFGQVFLMRHKELDVLFAVKQIRDSMNDTERHQLLTDLDIIRESHCPFIVRYHGFFVSEGDVWIFMESMRESLDMTAALLKTNSQRFPEHVLGTIAVASINGLHYLKKELKVVHRDVKPSNILLGHDGSVKVCDFGVSKTMVQTMMNTNVGCERYLPPERLDPTTSRSPYDVTSDVWAYGLSLIELADLGYPYPGAPFKRMMAIISKPPPKVTDTMYGIKYSDSFTDLCNYCLAKDPQKRPKYDTAPNMNPTGALISLLEHPFIKQHSQTSIAEQWARLKDWRDNVSSSGSSGGSGGSGGSGSSGGSGGSGSGSVSVSVKGSGSVGGGGGGSSSGVVGTTSSISGGGSNSSAGGDGAAAEAVRSSPLSETVEAASARIPAATPTPALAAVGAASTAGTEGAAAATAITPTPSDEADTPTAASNADGN